MQKITSAARLNCCNNYDFNRRLINNVFPIVECNLECKCANNEEQCLNRVVQFGPQCSLEVFECSNKRKGKGVRSRSELIPKGSFVVEYAGEIIGSIQAEKLFRQRASVGEPNYLMHLREYFATGREMKSTIIDARNYSNIARFINHSCEPNLLVLPVRINNTIPHAALFALRDIQIGEELSYDYNGTNYGATMASGANKSPPPVEGVEGKKVVCFCESKFCKGFLPNMYGNDLI